LRAIDSSSNRNPGEDSNPVRTAAPTLAKLGVSFLRVENPRPTPRGCSPEPVNISTGRAFIGRPLMKPESIPAEHIDERILFVRAHKVMLDADLAALYGVPTKVLVQAVRRNIERFPQDFMFQLTQQELRILRSQIVTSSSRHPEKWGGRRTLPYAFSEQGVAMLSSVLRSSRAIAVNIAIMRAFVRLRAMVAANAELAQQLDELERRIAHHDEAITSVVHAIRELMAPREPKPKRRIGFIQD
jgi:hypothetical protein